MLKHYLGSSSDIFGLIGALTTGIIAFKVAVGLFRFLSVHFVSKILPLSANLKKAGSWAVITGSTDGIGKAYAEQLAARGINVVLISRTLSRLTDMAKEIEEKYKVQTLIIAADFTQGNIYEDIKSKLQNLDISVLVNNVGMSYEYPEYFGDVDSPTFVQDMLHMNCTSVAKMTEIVLPCMLKKRCGYVINIGSSAGTNPVPFLALYSATKAFVSTFSNALQHEYGSKGITFQCIVPYFVVSKLSKFRYPSLFVPSPTTFVKNALNTVGILTHTTGYWAHEIQDIFMPWVPIYFVKAAFLTARSKALKRKQTSSKTE
ncbi:very-long-chain 3-oxoacyl-CoA reductase-like [Physella acuta]|uniref:very-long-chain 3-oxoacyl-CoA reductase-like n=1 Tax=Physella acuta TaxID=109671 RepID=UPI0027DDBD03|nr:very-long-chain 3-oxoacyl-CoA reductase-like [Physella acuta]